MNWIKPSPPNQAAHFSELFFDIIFVFSIVQIVKLFHGHFDLLTVYKAAVIFWIVWWLWTQFTWTVNGVDTRDDIPKFAIILVTGISFFMATTIPYAFEDKGFLFAIAFVIARSIGLIMHYILGLQFPKEARKGINQYIMFAIPSMVFVIVGGLVPLPFRYVFWGLVAVSDIASTFIAGREKWIVYAEHFTERHGLFMIIALGETLIINASGLSGSLEDLDFFFLATIAVAVTLGLWWNYFGHTKDKMAEVMEKAGPENSHLLARDGYSLLHFPIFFGVITYASALEDIIHHPFDVVNSEIRLAFAVGSILFLVGIAAVIYRLTKKLLTHRIIISIIGTLVILFLPDILPLTVLSIILAQVILIAIIEEKMEFFAVAGHSEHLQ